MKKTAAETETQIHLALSRAFMSLAFSPDEGPGWPSADASWWFSRRKSKITEMIWCRLRWRPKAIMTVELVASQHTLAVLRKLGLEGRAAAHNLFNFQVVFLETDPTSILPQVIPLKKATDPVWSSYAFQLAIQIASEIRNIELRIWSDLRAAL